MNSDDKFDYTYSAPTESERREIESIKKQYTPTQKQAGLDDLRKLNKRVTKPPMIVGIILGVVGTLTLGLGMAMALEWNVLVGGAIVGVIGIAVAAVAYPVYKAMLGRNKQKYARQIIDLSDELLHTEQHNGE